MYINFKVHLFGLSLIWWQKYLVDYIKSVVLISIIRFVVFRISKSTIDYFQVWGISLFFGNFKCERTLKGSQIYF